MSSRQSSASVLSQRAPRVVAMMNQKGGVGKTTTTVNLAAGIAELGRSVLVVDLDPQAHASLHLGVTVNRSGGDQTPQSVYDVLTDPSIDPFSGPIRQVSENLAVLPAETDLAGLETELSELEPAERTTRLRRVLEQLGGKYEFVLIDCPPSLGVLTLNGLAAAREVFIPMQAQFLALQGVSKLLETVSLVSKTVNPNLSVTGVILCMHDGSTTHSREVVDDLTSFLEQARESKANVPWKNAHVLQPPIRRNIKLAECPSFGKTIFQYSPWCPGALDYRALAEGVIVEWDALTARSRDKKGESPVVVKARHGAAKAGTAES